MTRSIPTVIGVDPGSSGAACWLFPDGTMTVRRLADGGTTLGPVVWNDASPEQQDRAHASLLCLTGLPAAVEKVSASPVMSPASAFAFGRGYQAMVSLFLPDLNPTPQQWQKHWSSFLAGTTGDARKRALHGLAKDIAPGIPLYAADAVLIAHWARHTLFNANKG